MKQLSIFLEHPLYQFILPFSRNELRNILQGMQQSFYKQLPDAFFPYLEIYFVTDAKIASCNDSHMGRIGPTNILTFPFSKNLPGTLVLSLDTLQRECLLYGQNISRHLVFLLAHGLAHIRGDDHSSPFFQDRAKEYEAAGLKMLAQYSTHLH